MQSTYLDTNRNYKEFNDIKSKHCLIVILNLPISSGSIVLKGCFTKNNWLLQKLADGRDRIETRCLSSAKSFINLLMATQAKKFGISCLKSQRVRNFEAVACLLYYTRLNAWEGLR